MSDKGKVTIELVEPNPFFIIPNKLHLTEETPGPVEVNPELFSDTEKLWITNAHNSKKIKVVKTGEYLVQKPKQPVFTQVAATQEIRKVNLVENTGKPAGQELPTSLPEALSKSKKLLSGSVSKILHGIKEVDDLLHLRALKDLESQKKKPRRSVIKALDAKLDKANQLVADKLGNEALGEGKYFITSGFKVDESQLEIMEDVEEKTIEIRPAQESDFTDEVVE